MAAVWEQRWAELVRRVAALRESTALELLPDIMPVLPLVPPELAELVLSRRDRLCSGWATQIAVAGQLAQFRVTNLSSNMLVVVEKVLVHPKVTGMFFGVNYGLTATTANTGSRAYTDTRGVTLTTSGPQASLAAATTVAHPTMLAGSEWAPPDVTTELRMAAPAVLGPGGQLYIGANVVNVECICNVKWRERVVDPSELQASGA